MKQTKNQTQTVSKSNKSTRKEKIKKSILIQSVDSLAFYEKNPRKHSDEQISTMAANMRLYGFLGVILVDTDNKIVAGHARAQAAKIAGIDLVPTIKLSHLSQKEINAFRLFDNQIAAKSEWDTETLKIEIQEIEKAGLDIELTGFTTCEIDILMNDIVFPPEKMKRDPFDAFETGKIKPSTARLGQRWQLGRHYLYCGDALDPESFEKVLEKKAADLVFTDPPYNVPVVGHIRSKGDHAEFVMASGEMTDKEFIEFLKKFMNNIHDFSRDGSIHYICMDWRHTPHVYKAARKIFGNPKQLCVWNKTNGGQGSFYRSKHELIHIFKKGKSPHVNNFKLGQSGRYRTNVWDYPGVNTMKKNRQEELDMHPTVKPTALVADAIIDHIKDNLPEGDELVKASVQKITVGQEILTIDISPEHLRDFLEEKLKLAIPSKPERPLYIFPVPFSTSRANKGAIIMSTKISDHDPLDLPPHQLRNLVRGIVWRDEHFDGMSIEDIAAREGLSKSGIRKIIMGSFDTLMAL